MQISRARATDQYQITQIIRLSDIRLGDPDCTFFYYNRVFCLSVKGFDDGNVGETVCPGKTFSWEKLVEENFFSKKVLWDFKV